ncbi:MAG: AAA family ATPase [Candidatus Omnitrophica bacterium]|nr:AAA family ATPase [Candidatus Omnitrophota bacterium]
MYTEYWQLQCLPFENTPDPRFFYQSPQHQEGLARLSYVVESRKGAGMLSGVFGCGKTLLARALFAQLSAARHRMVYLANPLMSEVELLHAVARKLNVPNLPDRRSDVLVDVLLDGIGRALRDNDRDGKQTLVVVDEAHLIHEEQVLEELRLLLNFQEEDRFLLTLILMGQPELKDVIDRHKPLAQRICMGYHLTPFSKPETAEYTRHRLTVAGAAQPTLFTERALALLHDSSGGIPRRINQLADLALLAGMGKGAKQVDEALLQDSLASIGV